jgi:ferritin
MISQAMVAALNHQIKHELYSSYLYLSMAGFCEQQGLGGFAHWMRIQTDEERTHAMKIYDYLVDNGAPVVLEAIEQPPASFGGPKKMFEAVLEHERSITQRIHNLMAQAKEEHDYRTDVFLQWFVSEQLEEEKNASDILQRIELVDERMSSVLWIDKELKKRGS